MNRRAIALLACLASFAACGYTTGTGLRSYGVRTIAFEVVGNESYRQRMEVELNRYLTKELANLNDVVLADRSTADAVLQVVLADARERTVVIGTPREGDPFSFSRVREGALEGAVRVRLVGRDGTVHLERLILDRTEFRTPMGENLTTARAEMAEDLARKIALALEDDFTP